MKTILVPTDFSENASNAVRYAIAIAKKEKAKIVFLHAFHITYISPDVPVSFISEELEAVQQSSEKKLKTICAKARKSKITCDYLNERGGVTDVILSILKKKKPDMVIMGTKGARGIKEVLVGSNTARIIERVSCPVIAVPANARFKGIKKILYASDYHESGINELKKVARLARLFNASISVLHASDKKFSRYGEESFLNDFKNKAAKKVKYQKITYKLAYGKYLPKVLDEQINKELPDLIALSTGHRNFFEKIFGTSVTKKMAFHSKVPLIAFHH